MLATRFCLLALVLVAALLACAPTVTEPTAEPWPEPTMEPTLPEPDQDEPVSSDDPEQTKRPEPDEKGRIYGKANVGSLEILLLESFPLQVNAVVSGFLPDGCSAIHEITQERVDNTIELVITTSREIDAVCTQALVPFEEVISLDVLDLPAGEYTVLVNGVESKFEFVQDNVLQEQKEVKPADLFIRKAFVDDVTVQVLDGPPLQVNVTVYGHLPDGCSSIGDVVTLRDKGDFNVTLMSQRPADQMCITVLTPYEESFSLDVADLAAGTYTVEVNGVTASFDLP